MSIKGRKIPPKYTAAQHIEQRVTVLESGCWLWKRQRDKDGYGIGNYAGKTWKAHRLSYTARVGQIPDGCVLDHLCRNPGCCNPAHLEAVDTRTNVVERGVTSASAINAKKTHCIRGHELTGTNVIPEKGGGRHCRECRKVANREWRRRKAPETLAHRTSSRRIRSDFQKARTP
jgi:hypothetical protein